MASSIPVKESDITAPTPQNTPLQAAPITLGLSRPTVPDIAEDGEDDIDGPLGAAALSGLVQGRLATLLGRSSGYVESLPTPVRRAVAGLKGVQAQYNDLQAQYKRECWELEKKYAELQKPLYERRTAIVAGESTPTTDEFERGEAVSKEDDDEYEPLGAPSADEGSDAAAAKGVPEFWLTALRNHVELAEIITDKDAEVLKHLTDIRLSYLPSTPAPGYKLTFVFSPNEWFENTELEKTYVYQTEVGYGGDFIYERAIGTDIKWKSEEKDLTKVVEVKKQRNKNTNRTRLVKKTRPADSFFNFFSPPTPPKPEDEDDMDEEELADIELKLEVDYQIGEDFKEKLVPRAIDYFTGKALEYETDDEDDFEDFDDDDDEGASEDDDDEDEPDSDDDVPPRRRKGGRSGGGGRAGGGNQNVDPEACKQQ